MDGLDAIYRGRGRVYSGERDDFYLSAVDNSLAFFAQEGIRATYFLIAADLDHPEKAAAIRRVAQAGHEIACHGLRHRYLNRISADEKREEIVAGKQKIEDALAMRCEGFRAPGYSIDYESLEVLREAGYRYDSSVFPTYAFRKRLGIQRLFPEPFLLSPGDGFFEIPLPVAGPGLPPFHPCYSFYLGRAYYNYCLEAFAKRHNYLTLLFHLTDFAERQALGGGLRTEVFTNNFYSGKSKLAFLRRLVHRARERFSFSNTSEFLRAWPASAPDLNPRTILGISTTHETGACIVRDGELLAALNEERLSRRKLDNRFPPVQSIREAIRLSGIEAREIDAVAIAGLHWKDLLPQSLESLWRDITDFHAWNDYIPHLCRIAYRGFYFWRATQYKRVLEHLKKQYGIAPKAFFLEHHECHAASARLTGAGGRALVVTADGVGDDVCITFNRADGSMIRRLETFFYPHSFGQFYTACTQVLGFKGGRHEGKITGLSGFGKPNEALLKKVEGTLLTGGGFRVHKRFYAEGFIRLRWRDLKNLAQGKLDVLSVDYRNYKPPLKRLLRGHTREDIAYAFQSIMEREMVRLAERHTDGQPVRLELAGGLFANVKLNMAMGRRLNADSIYIFPQMGDGGLGVGAALSVAAARPRLIRHMYWGTAYSEEEILRSLERYPSLASERPAEMAETLAAALADGKIVARFDGRMEYGPRALGNRSILYHCSDPSVNKWLNHQLRRTEFMPFAPICRWEDAEEYFEIREGEKRACEFMTYVVPCTVKMRETCPAAVHVDGTARPQLVRREINPGLHAILSAYKRHTGIGCLINTSFNMHEEPIVRSPEDAISAFQQSHLNFLALGPLVVWNPESEKSPSLKLDAASGVAAAPGKD